MTERYRPGIVQGTMEPDPEGRWVKYDETSPPLPSPPPKSDDVKLHEPR